MKSRELLSLAACAAILACSAQAAPKEWKAPAAKKITFKPAAAVIGMPVKINCALGANPQTFDSNSPLGKYLASERKPSWTLPAEIFVDGTSINKEDWAGLASLTSTWNYDASWVPPAKYAGKKVKVDCVVDGTKKMLYSTQSAWLTVLKELPPKVNLKNQKAPTVAPIPGGPKVPERKD
jgi:hypothetical protein